MSDRQGSPVHWNGSLHRVSLRHQDLEFAGAKDHGLVVACWPPCEPALRKALLAQPESAGVIDKQLDGCLCPVGKSEDGATERITHQLALTDSLDTVDSS